MQTTHCIEYECTKSLFLSISTFKTSIFKPPIHEMSPRTFHIFFLWDSFLPIITISKITIRLYSMFTHIFPESLYYQCGTNSGSLFVVFLLRETIYFPEIIELT